MSVRKARKEDLHNISSVCIDAFMGTVAATLKEEGVNTFRSIASVSSLEGRMSGDNEMLVYESNQAVVGYLELKEGRHIAMLFVSPDCQGQGVGKSLISAMSGYARTDVITVSASLTSVSAYQNYGFENTGAVAESSGLTYQPMEITISTMENGTERSETIRR